VPEDKRADVIRDVAREAERAGGGRAAFPARHGSPPRARERAVNRRRTVMIVIRNRFVAKPGMAGKLAAQMKEAAVAGKLTNARVMTDLAGDFNVVVMEHEAQSLTEFEAKLREYMGSAEMREKMKGYTDLWTTGSREIFQIA